jgi:hypothetical protein
MRKRRPNPSRMRASPYLFDSIVLPPSVIVG